MNFLQKLLDLPMDERVKKGVKYTPLEIASQPRLWIENFKLLEKRENEIRSFLETNIFSKRSPRVILSGAGSSEFIGLAAQNLLRYMWGFDVDSRATTDIVTHWNSIFIKRANNTVISFSRSGNSPESVGSIILANRFCEKVNHIIVTCNKAGKLAEMGRKESNVFTILLSEETEDKGLAMTSSFTTMLMTAQFLACINDLEKYEGMIRDLSIATERIFKEYSGTLNEVSKINFNRALFLGSGCLNGCAVESALKLQEMTCGKVICKADSFTGVRHGPEVIIDDETIIVYFLSSNPFIRRYELNLMREISVKDLGLKKIVVCNKADGEMEDCVDYAIEFNKEGEFNIGDMYRPVMDVTVGQMLGLFKSLDLRLKPDTPSEKGIITRVVKGVKIYDPEIYKSQRDFIEIA